MACAHNKASIAASFEQLETSQGGHGSIYCAIVDREGKASDSYELVLSGSCLPVPLHPFRQPNNQILSTQPLDQGIFEFPVVPECGDLQLTIIAQCQLYQGSHERQCDTERYYFPVVVKAGQCTRLAIKLGCYNCNWVFY
jgi:hypothetical protein